ncbi:TPA: hypothetical protein N0F65_005955 [Lagenidium giganteum]|uniref:EF-hand domain-containing protein n=1 Tax=Lagenidium giganteum TaxID=4803 RepID=A0AAV2ZCK9_9STRA|nr:TPA: hypothetical protein N0F65_005955 [Lagenidium giganteum]
MTIREAVRAAFKRYDADGSGSINVRELQALVADLGGVLSDAQVAQVAKLLDKDGNGDVSEAEFLRWWSSESADLDGDGVVTDVELALRRLRDVGATRFYTDIHVAVWHAQVDVVQRLLDENAELVNDKDASDYGV